MKCVSSKSSGADCCVPVCVRVCVCVCVCACVCVCVYVFGVLIKSATLPHYDANPSPNKTWLGALSDKFHKPDKSQVESCTVYRKFYQQLDSTARCLKLFRTTFCFLKSAIAKAALANASAKAKAKAKAKATAARTVQEWERSACSSEVLEDRGGLTCSGEALEDLCRFP